MDRRQEFIPAGTAPSAAPDEGRREKSSPEKSSVKRIMLRSATKPLAGGLCNQCCEFVIAHSCAQTAVRGSYRTKCRVHTVATPACRRCLHVLKHRVRQAISKGVSAARQRLATRMKPQTAISAWGFEPAPAMGRCRCTYRRSPSNPLRGIALHFIELAVEPTRWPQANGGFGIEEIQRAAASASSVMRTRECQSRSCRKRSDAAPSAQPWRYRSPPNAQRALMR